MPYGYQKYGSGLMGLQPGFEGLASGLGQRAQQRLDPDYRHILFDNLDTMWNEKTGNWFPGTEPQVRMGITPTPIDPTLSLAQGLGNLENLTFEQNEDPFVRRFAEMLFGGGLQQQAQTGLGGPPPQPPAPMVGPYQGRVGMGAPQSQGPGMAMILQYLMSQMGQQGAGRGQQQAQLTQRQAGGAVEREDKIDDPVAELIAMINAEREGGVSEIPMVLHEGEYVLNPEAVTALGGEEALNQINEQAQAGPSGGASGSFGTPLPNISFLGQMARDLMGQQQAPSQEMMPPYQGRPNRPPQTPQTATPAMSPRDQQMAEMNGFNPWRGNSLPGQEFPDAMMTGRMANTQYRERGTHTPIKFNETYYIISNNQIESVMAELPGAEYADWSSFMSDDVLIHNGPPAWASPWARPPMTASTPAGIRSLTPEGYAPEGAGRGSFDIEEWLRVEGSQLGAQGTDFVISQAPPNQGWTPLSNGPNFNGHTVWLPPEGQAAASSPSTPQVRGGGEAAATPAVDPLAAVQETAPLDVSYQKPPPVTKPDKTGTSPAGKEAAGAAPREMPDVEWRQSHQSFGLDLDYIKNASPEDAMVYLRNVATNRETHSMTRSQLATADPNRLPPKEALYNQMVAQYAGVKLTPETIRDAQLTNDFNENTQAAREDLIIAQAEQAVAQAEVSGGTVEAEIARLEALTIYTQAQARSINLDTDFLEANEGGRQTLYNYSMEQAGLTNDIYKDMGTWTLKNLQANTQLALAQAAAYGAEGAALDTILNDPEAYAGLIEDSQQLRDDRIRTITQANQELRASLDDTGLSNKQKQQIEAEIFRNTFLIQWVTTPGDMESTTLKDLANAHTRGSVDRLLNQFGWESIDEFTKLKARAAEILAGLDLVAQVLPDQSAFGIGGGATPMQVAPGGGAMQSGGQANTDTLDLAFLGGELSEENYMEALRLRAAEGTGQ